MRQRTQNERVLYALRVAGPHGISQPDFLGPDTIDGLKPILRLPSRINDLRAAGHEIVAAGRRNKCRVYVLVEPPRPRGEATSSEEVAHAESLFEPAHRPLSAYDPRAES